MIQELDQVVLLNDLPEHHLQAGDVGTVVLVYVGQRGYEVEFTDLSGATLAVVSLYADQVRQVVRGEIAHARQISL